MKWSCNTSARVDKEINFIHLKCSHSLLWRVLVISMLPVDNAGLRDFKVLSALKND